jgi:hypothetical protein
MAAAQSWHCCNVVTVFIALDNNREFSPILHRSNSEPILSLSTSNGDVPKQQPASLLSQRVRSLGVSPWSDPLYRAGDPHQDLGTVAV